jgi:DNA-binding beta-propeller fold protein YncE
VFLLAEQISQKEVKEMHAALKRVESKKKKKTLSIGLVAIAAIIIILLAFFLTPAPPETPLCENGVQDQGEEGIDCGGSCEEKCPEPPPPEYIDDAYIKPSSVADIAVDLANDRIYVLDELRHRVMVYDSEFNHLKNFGERREQTADGGWNYFSGGEANDQLLFPAAIFLADDKAYILDRSERIKVFSKDLVFEKELTFSSEAYEVLPKIDDPPTDDGGMSSFVVSPDGRFYVADEQSHVVVLLDTDFKMAKVVERGSDEGKVEWPMQLSLAANGNLFVADSGNGRIQVFDPELNFLESFNENLIRPVGIKVLENNQLLVVDDGDSKLKLFDEDKKFVKSIGGFGSQDGMFFNPKAVKLDSEGNVYIVDKGNVRVQAFNKSLSFKSSLEGLKASLGISFNPFYVAVSTEGDIAFTDPINTKVFVFDSDFKLKKILGKKGFGDGEFGSPKGIAFGPEGKLFVSDGGNERVQIFSKDFDYIKSITPENLLAPLAVSVSEEGKVFVVDDKRKVVMVFDKEGKLLDEIGEERGITMPLGVIARDSKVYITDHIDETIEVFNSQLKKEKSVTDIAEALGVDVAFTGGLGIDSLNRLLVCNKVVRQVVAYDLETAEFLSFGDFGSSLRGLSVIHVAANDKLTVVSDMEHHRGLVIDSEGNVLKEITKSDLS